jgi:hypothetical protein
MQNPVILRRLKKNLEPFNQMAQLRARSDGLRSEPALREREELTCISTERAKLSFTLFGELSGADQF